MVHAPFAPPVELTVLTAFVLLLCLLGAIVPLSRRRAESRPAGWFQISSYRNGMVAHLTPIRDRVHAEDEFGECSCNPKSGPYPLDDGRVGVLYIHRAGRRSPYRD